MVILPVTKITFFYVRTYGKGTNSNCDYRFDSICYDEKEAKERLVSKLKEVGASNTDLLNFW